MIAGGITASAFVFLRPPAHLRDFWAVQSEWDAAVRSGKQANDELAEHCLDVARHHSGTVGGLSAVLMAATGAPKSAAGTKANQQLVQQIETVDLNHFAKACDQGVRGDWRPLHNLAPALLARVRQDPDHPQAARLLAAVCAAACPDEEQTPPPVYEEAAHLIAENYAASPKIVHFCESLRGGPSWAVAFETHLRNIRRVNQDRFVRCTAQFALANVVQSTSEDRQAEAETLFEQFLVEFNGQHSYPAQGIELHYIAESKVHLAELRHRALGQPTPDITGFDLDHKSMRLSDFRGRVVLLNFWGTWCFPCMKLVPHEREIVKTFQGQPFDIVGVNCDDNIVHAREAANSTQMTWRSFQDQIDGKPTITKEWNIAGFPTLYLIDHHGVIRRRWIGSPPPEELKHMIRVLVDAATQNLPVDAMGPVVALLPLTVARADQTGASTTVDPQSGSGFVEKVFRGSDGTESKYLVFVPRTYDGTRPFPAILYLHGAGSRGTDGKLPIQSGLAKAIRAQGEEFPFLVVFPQAREGENWTADSTGGKRALAILDQIQTDYVVDADRVSLTGHSMGGQGTWSLAAADNQRWAAIVPISHGGDTKSAGRLIDVPCWCFHGEADKLIPSQQSRDMVRAIQDAGGHPFYHEFNGVGHDDCPDRAYAVTDLLEWILAQNRQDR